MSGDVQPRRRKDKKKKRDSLDRKSEGDIYDNKKDEDDVKESHHGVHAAKMGADDVLLHVQDEHVTGGHWCAKILFFSLLAILLGLIGLIIMENRGLADLDTPLSKSRYSEYFEGWVDEHRQSHDEHNKITDELEGNYNEVFKELEDEDENDDDHDHEDDGIEKHHDDHEDENVEHDDDHDDDDDDENDENEEEKVIENDDDDDQENVEETDDEEIRGTEEDEESDLPSNKNEENDDDDNEEDEEVEEEVYSKQQNNNDDDKENENQNDVDNDDNENNDQLNKNSEDDKYDFANGNDPFDEIEDDTNDEEIVDNDKEEFEHFERQAKEQDEINNANDEQQNDEEEYSSSQIKSKRDDRQQNNNNNNNNNYDYASLNEQLRRARKEESQNNLKISLDIYESILLKYPNNPEALYGKAKILDRLSDIYQNNHILNDAIEAYKKFLVTVNNKSIISATGYTTTTITKTTKNTATTVNIDNVTFKEAAERCIDRMRFRGLHLNAVPVHQMLIKRFNDDPYYRNQLAVTYLLVNRLTDAKNVLNETLKRWPNDGFAQVHYGFVLKNLDNNLEEAIKYLKSGIKTNDNGTKDGRFYFHLGDALQRLNRNDEAKLIYKKGAELKLFLSEYQRSLYNVNNLKAKPFWTINETSYQIYFDILERNWEKIRDEGLNILNSKGLFVNESENLKDTGDWKQYELFTRGSKNVKNCEKVPFTCKLIEIFPMARYCKRGQTKFSVIHPGTHVWPHCGPTNCRLRAHLGLKIPSGTKIRVANEERTWKEGKFLIFDDSFEHEVWHNGTSIRLVLIVDVWHPELTDEQKQTLSLI